MGWFEWVLVENMIFVVVVLLQYVCLVKLKHNKKGKNLVKKMGFFLVFSLIYVVCVNIR
jgi:hypothetical protein